LAEASYKGLITCTYRGVWLAGAGSYLLYTSFVFRSAIVCHPRPEMT